MGKTQGVKAMPMPISSAQSAEKGSWAAGFDVSLVGVPAGVGGAASAAATARRGRGGGGLHRHCVL
ncbi:hypothetical protein C9F09_12200 [Salmonella enterica subsp. enterica serovar Wilhelmsburg]|uniref:Uncharacterized protein n=1 Tax=Salmonella enterica subsp. enterica serovar Wilhelmsburg TaxID=1960126 RepID=A0A659QXN1_SALET|nr:hypothetical protein C9F09_12200 [Salmonella enterica subsp. enterica serovar Wilhelmsburg]